MIKGKRERIEGKKKRKYDGCEEDGRREAGRVRKTCEGVPEASTVLRHFYHK